MAEFQALGEEVITTLNDLDERPRKGLSRNLSSGSLVSTGSSNSMELATEMRGDEGTLDFRITHVSLTASEHKKVVSLWHDLPLYVLDPETNYPTGAVNFVCEIPKCSRKKYELATDEPNNPIKQDTKKGELREFKKGDLYFNYGCMPRTWEDPDHVHPDTGYVGDNDPLDVCEIGLRIIPVGEVRQVKVLGILCLIDDDETDWKVVVIDVNDRWASELNDISDVEELLPGTVDSIREWFRTYKIPDGKPPNKFGLEERCMDKAYAMRIIHETHQAWKGLVSGKSKRNLSVTNLEDLDTTTDDHATSSMHDIPAVDPDESGDLEDSDPVGF